nr:eIF-2-alpha kinase activator GCN1 isoform X22 [Ipomoea batatas]
MEQYLQSLQCLKDEKDDSSEVRRRALSSLKIAAKSNPSAVMIHVSKYGPVLAECMNKYTSQSCR